MVDTPRTAAYLQNALRDGQTAGSILPQVIRDFAVSTMSTADGITAAGTTQGTATGLSASRNIVATVATGTGVIPLFVMNFIVLNRGANALLVYPISGAQWEGFGTNVAVSIAPGGSAEFIMTSSTQGYAR